MMEMQLLWAFELGVVGTLCLCLWDEGFCGNVEAKEFGIDGVEDGLHQRRDERS